MRHIIAIFILVYLGESPLRSPRMSLLLCIHL